MLIAGAKFLQCQIDDANTISSQLAVYVEFEERADLSYQLEE